MIRAATVHARLLLSRPYVRQAKAASSWPLVPRKPPLLGCVRPYYQMEIKGRDEIRMLATRGCHSSAENQELAKKSCVPCNSKDIHPMSEDSAKKLLEQVNGWELTTEGGILKLHRAWKVKNFIKGLEFFQLVAAIAEEEGHHPDLHLVGWNNVKIDVWTHSVRGLTNNDFILAAKINHLNLEGILRKKANVQK
uniref:4a-hydroxytetrahydrobiopterin dehydratase n=1 Tax=Arundo donax TaxID=35708 RepID=A0A0A9GLD7_ARUDO